MTELDNTNVPTSMPITNESVFREGKSSYPAGCDYKSTTLLNLETIQSGFARYRPADPE